MGQKDARVDAYIDKSADFAKPILRHIRQLIHTACPDVQETIKWRFPSFVYSGILCNMAAFKKHCALVFWRSAMRSAVQSKTDAASAGRFRNITALGDLPADKILLQTIEEAAKLNASGEKPKRRPRLPKKNLRVPASVSKVLKQNKKASAGFKNLSPSHQREYKEWIAGAKRPETRDKRLATMVQWLEQGKSRNWKYEK